MNADCRDHSGCRSRPISISFCTCILIHSDTQAQPPHFADILSKVRFMKDNFNFYWVEIQMWKYEQTPGHKITQWWKLVCSYVPGYYGKLFFNCFVCFPPNNQPLLNDTILPIYHTCLLNSNKILLICAISNWTATYCVVFLQTGEIKKIKKCKQGGHTCPGR
jgi:hypothetical protein